MKTYAPPKLEQSVDSVDLAALIRTATAAGHKFCFNAPGKSMEPFIRSGDKIFISPVEKDSIQLGDILAFVHPQDGRVLAHRVVRIGDGKFYCKGDNINAQSDGWIPWEDVLGRVERVQRDEKDRHLGLGVEKRLIALLSRRKSLVPLLNILRRVKRMLAKPFSG